MDKEDDNGRPYTNMRDIIREEARMAFDKRVEPVCKDLQRAVENLDLLVPEFQKVNDRSYWNRVWLIVLTLGTLLALGLITA